MTLGGIKTALWRTGEDIGGKHTLQMAAALSYYFVMALFPALVLLSAIVAYLPIPDLFNQAGAAIRKAGIQFAYHNHYWEFIPCSQLGGKLPYDFLLESTDPANVKMELDLCWITVAGKDPLAYFKNYQGRFVMVHVKDLSQLPKIDVSRHSKAMISDVAVNFTPIGGGLIPWKTLLPAAQDAGVQHFFVENDEPKDAIANITASYEYLNKLRF